MIRIKRCICLNNKVTDETSYKINLICIAKEKVLYNLMFSDVIFHYILFQASEVKTFQFGCFQGQRLSVSPGPVQPGERYCQDCIQEAAQPDAKDVKRHHCWAAMGYDFKSDIRYYNVPGNANGKMSQRVYIDQILEPVIKPWLDQEHDFVLEEDGDSGHGPGKSNIVRAWKEKHNLKHYFNCAASPDLSPIENY
jgi:hypothetical protein